MNYALERKASGPELFFSCSDLLSAKNGQSIIDTTRARTKLNGAESLETTIFLSSIHGYWNKLGLEFFFSSS
jgi:hypothetical protein